MQPCGQRPGFPGRVARDREKMIMKYVAVSVLAALCAFSSGVARAQDYRKELTQARSYMGDSFPKAAAKDDSVLRHVPDLKKSARGYTNACDTQTDVRVRSVDLGGALRDAKLVYDPDSGCWGQAGGQLTVLDDAGRVVWSNSAGGIIVLSSAHGGVRDLSFAGPGFSDPIWVWDAPHHQYKFLKNIDE